MVKLKFYQHNLILIFLSLDIIIKIIIKKELKAVVPAAATEPHFGINKTF